MGNMRFKVGDRVRIKSLDWYNKNKNEDGIIGCGNANFIPDMKIYCGDILTICDINEELSYYYVTGCQYSFKDEMIEGLVEEETLIERVDDNGLPFSEWLSHKGAFYIPDGYVLKDENGNIINAQKIVLEKKKKEYPKTFRECQECLGEDVPPMEEPDSKTHRRRQVHLLEVLLICRDAYWKIAGEEMGLGKPWIPDWNDDTAKYSIYTIKGVLTKAISCYDGAIFAFPTAEMRDAFYENFKEEIESCKELL